jgi:nucleotide-binding universal stress UspA family protein
MYDPILVALDGSSRAEQVLPHAADLAATVGRRVVLLQVIEPPTAAFESSLDRDRHTHVEWERVSRYLAGQLAQLQEQGTTALTEVAEGAPSEIIVQRAAEMSAGLIAMSTRGKGGLGRLIFGSVATAVARSAACPVFVIRPTIRGRVLGPRRQILAIVGGGDTVDAGVPGHAAVFTSHWAAALTLLRTTVSVAALRAGSGPGPHPRELVARERLDAAIEVAELGRDLRERCPSCTRQCEGLAKGT